jgi:hypothetical protein
MSDKFSITITAKARLGIINGDYEYVIRLKINGYGLVVIRQKKKHYIL